MAKKASNKKLHSAKNSKKDEFYTQLNDIANELKHYRNQLEGKIIFCNCDDPFESNFFKYFAANFNALKIKKLITTSYVKSPIVGGQLPLFEIEGLKPDGKEPYLVEINEVPDLNNDGAISLDDVEYLLKHNKNVSRRLHGDEEYSAGDFRSKECLEFLKQADIVVTNPPFSLFREYVAQLAEYKKKFLIIGNVNAITYKEIFHLIKEDGLWLGITMDGRNKWFRVPDEYPINENVANSKIENGNKYLFVKGCVWFTNLDNEKRHDEIPLYKKYSKKEYPRYDNYDAINVDKVSEIPVDYYDIMGVPITFLNKYNPNQFEILGITDRQNTSELRTKKYTVTDNPRFNDLNARSVLKQGNNYKAVYARLLIKIKK
jgi:hypothetical protein